MSEDTTQNLPIDLLRLILTRLDSVDQRLERVEHRLDRVEHRLDGLERRLDGLERRLDGLERRLDGVEQRLDRVEQRLDSMDQRIEKLEARAYDTKPIWERALAELIELSKRMDNLDRRFHVLTDDVIQNRADFRKFDQRLADLEQLPHA